MLQKIILNPSQITCSSNYKKIYSSNSTYEGFFTQDNLEDNTDITFHFENSCHIQEIKIIAKNSKNLKLKLSSMICSRDEWIEDHTYSYFKHNVLNNSTIFKCDIMCRKLKINIIDADVNLNKPFKIILYEKTYPRYDILNDYDHSIFKEHKELIYNTYINYSYIESANIKKTKYIKHKQNIQYNACNEKIEEGTSVLVCIKNRTSHLLKNMDSWLSAGMNEIIILDWSSDEILLPIILNYKNNKIRYVRVENENKYIRSYAQNLGAKLCRYNKLLKLDADIEIKNPNFLSEHPIRHGEFYVSDYLCARDSNERFTHGITYLYLEDYFKVNGYNEFIKDYGWDDSDFTIRLLIAGLHKKLFNLNMIYHLPHTNNSRIKNCTNFHPYLLTQLHRICCLNSKLWDNSFETQKFLVTQINSNYLVCQRTTNTKYEWDPEVYKNALEEASIMVFDWLKQPISDHYTWIKTKNYSKILEYLSNV